MLGAIIGDIVGSRHEFCPTNDYHFELFGEGCGFTDDTVCTIAVADALLKGRHYGVSLHEWCRRYPAPIGGYGGRFLQWVLSDSPRPYGSYGNGSAMRVSAVAWLNDACDVETEAHRSAECTHSHPEGINGAIAVAEAISGCMELRRVAEPGKPLTPNDILHKALSRAIRFYASSPEQFDVDLESCRNRFDETCQGTVPVALWIVMHSTGFEDALRRAVSLGADADTLGAIVGSIAEALWGIPQWIKNKALGYLPSEMVAVVKAFRQRRHRLLKLTQRCEYYRLDVALSPERLHLPAREIEKEWANDLARSYANADRTKAAMQALLPSDQWERLAASYNLPLSLIGYIFRHTAAEGLSTDERLNRLQQFLSRHYSCRKKKAADTEQTRLMMHWKLGLGNMGKHFIGQDPMPPKLCVATADSWHTSPLPDDPSQVSVCTVKWRLTAHQMQLLRMGHIPEGMEDHWFMYADDECIRYFRSWTGQCSFEAHYLRQGGDYCIHKVKINRNLAEFGVNGDNAGLALLRYLITAETGGPAAEAWQAYLEAWESLL